MSSTNQPDLPTRYEKLFSGDDWQTGDRMETLDGYRTAFEKHVWQELQPGKEYAGLGALPDKRIAILLKMLEWEGLREDQVATLSLKEFKERRVLPDAIFVASDGAQSAASTHAASLNTPPQPQPPQQPRPQRQERVSMQLPARKEITEEDITFITWRSKKSGNAQIRIEKSDEITTLPFAPHQAEPGDLGRAKVTRQSGKIIRVEWLGF
jgi:hypothetical protein